MIKFSIIFIFIFLLIQLFELIFNNSIKNNLQNILEKDERIIYILTNSTLMKVLVIFVLSLFLTIGSLIYVLSFILIIYLYLLNISKLTLITNRRLLVIPYFEKTKKYLTPDSFEFIDVKSLNLEFGNVGGSLGLGFKIVVMLNNGKIINIYNFNDLKKIKSIIENQIINNNKEI